MYSIIETTDKDGKKEVSAVLSNWIIENNVYWPYNYRKSIKQKDSVPGKYWPKYPCNILKSEIATLTEAKDLEKYFEFHTNTDEENYHKKKKAKYTVPNLNDEFDIVKDVSNILEISNQVSHIATLSCEVPPLAAISSENTDISLTTSTCQHFEKVDNSNILMDISNVSEISYETHPVSSCTQNDSKKKNIEEKMKRFKNKDISQTATTIALPIFDNESDCTSTVTDVSIYNEVSPLAGQVKRQNCCIGQALLDPRSSVITQNEIERSIDQDSSTKVPNKRKAQTKLANLTRKIDDLNSKIDLILENQTKNKIKQKKRDTKILQNQKVLKSFIEELININRQKSGKEITKDFNFKYPSVPMKTVAELMEFNNDLQDNHFIDQMTLRLYKYKSTSLNKTIKQMLEHLFTYELIRKYTWTGQSGIKITDKAISKRVFSENKNIVVLTTNVVNYMIKDQPTTEEQVKKAIQEFLKRSSIRVDRMKNRTSNI